MEETGEISEHFPCQKIHVLTMLVCETMHCISVYMIYRPMFFLLFCYMFIQTYTTLNLVSRDSLSAVTSQAERIIMEKTPHLQDHARVQVREKGSVKVGRGRGGGKNKMLNVCLIL